MTDAFDKVADAMKGIAGDVEQMLKERKAQVEDAADQVLGYAKSNPLTGLPDDVVEDMRSAIATSIEKLIDELMKGPRIVGLHLIAVTDTNDVYQSIAAPRSVLPALSQATVEQSMKIIRMTKQDMDELEAEQKAEAEGRVEEQCDCPGCQLRRQQLSQIKH